MLRNIQWGNIVKSLLQFLDNLFHPAFALILGFILAILAFAQIIDYGIAFCAFGAWFIAFIWIAKARYFKQQPLKYRLPLLLGIAVVLALFAYLFGTWALGHYYQGQKKITAISSEQPKEPAKIPSEPIKPSEKKESKQKKPAFKEPLIAKLPPTQAEPQPSPKESPPEVALRFVHSKRPALVITNLSDAVARDIKWMVLLWNMDLPERTDPLPIPVQSFDWLKGHQEGGPMALFISPMVSSLLKSDNRLFGSAAVDCPTCSGGRTYIIYIVLGQGGWFSEIENKKDGRVLFASGAVRDIYFNSLDSLIPEDKRLPIKEY